METSAGTRVADPLVGRVVDGRYRVEQRLARGGMDTVYVAPALRLDRTVALKLMHSSRAEDVAVVSRFVREAKSAARLSDPHVVAVYDQGEDGDLVYLVMEFVPGRTVRDVLRERGRLSAEQALTILDPVLQALDAAHRAGFVHRDVKPENVLLTDDGRVKVADFGLARAISAATSTAATQGLLIGTVAYLSPEQVERGIADARSDVYGAGILLYEMVTGSVPFAGETPLAVAYQHVNAEVPLPSSVRSGIPSGIDALGTRATERDAADRYPDAASFLAAVRAARRDLPAPRPFGVVEDQSPTLVVPLVGSASAATGPVRVDDRPRVVYPKKRRRGLVALIAVIMLGALAAWGGWYAGIGRTVAVPALVNLTPAAAEAKVAGTQLSLDTSQRAFSETVRAGLIVSTDPPAGAEARQGSTITAVVSKGPERHTVPQVAGMTVDDATTAITDSSLTVGTSTSAYSDTVAKGLVVTTDPAPKASLKHDQPVALVISKGPAPVPVPLVTGKPATDVVKALTALGLKVTTTQAFSKTVAAGAVISSTPKAGIAVPKGATVALVVSKGPPLVTVPDVYTMSEADAKKLLTKLGFDVKVTYPVGVTPFDRVIKQSLKANSQAPWGSPIEIQVV
jgi:serine/threonine-protein kinase